MFFEYRRVPLSKEEKDQYVLHAHEAWEGGWLKGRRPFPAWRVWLAKYRKKRRSRQLERDHWAEKMRKKAERKKLREEKAIAEQLALQQKK